MKVPLLDLRAQYLSIKGEVDEAIARVIERGNFVMGQEVEQWESEWARFCGAEYAVGVSSGTDALYLAITAVTLVDGGDKIRATVEQEKPLNILTTPFTFFATSQAIIHSGNQPVFMDVDETGNIDMGAVDLLNFPYDVHLALPVHLYGRPAPIPPGWPPIIEDSAQAHGLPLSPNARAACFSFYPSKNLGAMGQAGAVVTNDPEIASLVRELRTYGERERFVHYAPTGNYRMDEMQAAILRAKLPHLLDWNYKRSVFARAYLAHLSRVPGIVLPQYDAQHTWHIFAIRVTDPRGRDDLAKFLAEQGIQTAVRYPLPLHLQPALLYLGGKKGDFPNAEIWAKTNLSLPIWPEMELAQVEYVCEKVKEWSTLWKANR